MATPLCRAGLLYGLGDYVKALGGSFDQALERAGLEPYELRNPSHFITLQQECAVMDQAALLTGHPALMVEVTPTQSLAIFGAIGCMAAGSVDLRGGLEVFIKYTHYSVQALRISLKTEQGMAFTMLETDYQPALKSTQFWLHAVALLCQVIRILCGRRWAPRMVYLDVDTPSDMAPYHEFFRAPLAFGQGRNGLTFSSEVLDWPIESSLSSIAPELRMYLDHNHAGDFQAQVRAVLSSLLATRRSSAETVAATLGLSERTLQRKLAAEETSFRQLLEQTRTSLAINYLREPQFRLTDVAEMLGYADLSVFSRSFKRWFGLSPKQWRSEILTAQASASN